MPEPELGQLLFSNTVLGDFEVPRFVRADLEDLAERVGTERGDWSMGHGSLTGNNGAEEYLNPVFAMRSYCWCDGFKEGHEDQCPPNFEHFDSGVSVTWYKHVNRGHSANKRLTRALWSDIIATCFDSTGISEEDVLARREKDISACSTCKRSRQDLSKDDNGAAEVEFLTLFGRCLSCDHKGYAAFVALGE